MIRRRLLRRIQPDVNCREVGRVLQSYIDGDVESDFAAKIAAHLEQCRDCGLEYETYRQIKDSLASQGANAEVDGDAIDRLREFGRNLAND
ncbi:MAG: zf-HC2 domain-containing protein [Actinomycetota bacterium]